MIGEFFIPPSPLSMQPQLGNQPPPGLLKGLQVDHFAPPADPLGQLEPLANKTAWFEALIKTTPDDAAYFAGILPGRSPRAHR